MVSAERDYLGSTGGELPDCPTVELLGPPRLAGRSVCSIAVSNGRGPSSGPHRAGRSPHSAPAEGTYSNTAVFPASGRWLKSVQRTTAGGLAVCHPQALCPWCNRIKVTVVTCLCRRRRLPGLVTCRGPSSTVLIKTRNPALTFALASDMAR